MNQQDCQSIVGSERWVSKVDTSGDCHLWVASKKPAGYGQITFKDRPRYAHRVAWIAKNGEVPEGAELDHICRNRGCVNPDHLRAVSHMENMQNQPGFNVCKRGHDMSDNALVYYRENGSRKRMCRECNRLRSKGAL